MTILKKQHEDDDIKKQHEDGDIVIKKIAD